MAILTVFRHRFYKNDGTVNSGGKVYTYTAGTTTPTPTYTDSGAGTPNANPIILDSKGEADIWVSGLIKVNVLESDDTQVTGWPVDNIGAASGGSTTANATWAGTASGTANALTLTPSTAISAYAIGQSFIFKAGASANTSTTTISISGLSAIAVQSNGAACAGGEILANNFYMGVLDTLTTFQITKVGKVTLAELGLGTGVATALAIAVGTAGAVVTNGGALGTPSSGTLTSCTGLPQAGTVGLTTADSPEFAALNIGHASDTTLTRVSAGKLAQAGVTLADLGANTFTAAQNFARATVASHATTADIWAAAGNQIDWTGTATTTAFPNAPQGGAERVLICAGACSFTAGANMLIDGVASAATVTCAAGDSVIVRAVSTTQFKLSRVKYDGTAQVGGGLSAASQAEAEAATADTVAITPLSANWHPGVAKVLLKCGVSGNIIASRNVTSVTDGGAGLATVTIATDFSNTTYVPVCSIEEGTGKVASTDTIAAGSFRLRCIQFDATVGDPSYYYVVCFGDQ